MNLSIGGGSFDFWNDCPVFARTKQTKGTSLLHSMGLPKLRYPSDVTVLGLFNKYQHAGNSSSL